MGDSKVDLTEETKEQAAEALDKQTDGGKPQEPAGDSKDPAKEAKSDDLDTWKAESRKWESRAKANRDELDKMKAERDRLAQDTADRDKDLEKITTLEATNQDLQDKNKTLLKEAVAALKGVPAHRITGETREELEADADKFLAELTEAPKRGYVPTAGQGGEQPTSSIESGRERAREKARAKA